MRCCKATTRPRYTGCGIVGGGGKEPRSGAFMRLMGAVELSGGWHFTVSPPPVDGIRVKRGYSLLRRGRDKVAYT